MSATAKARSRLLSVISKSNRRRYSEMASNPNALVIYVPKKTQLATYNQPPPPPPPPSSENKSWRSFFKYTLVAALTGGVLTLSRLNFTWIGFEEVDRRTCLNKLLPDLHPEQHVFTLVLDLHETLICSDWKRERGWRTFKRPGVDGFLEHLAQFYEIVVYSDQLIMFVDPLVERLDPKHCIRFGLNRGATKYQNGKYYRVPVGGCYRLIDTPISNCVNNGINKIFSVTQFNSDSVNRHLVRTYYGAGWF